MGINLGFWWLTLTQRITGEYQTLALMSSFILLIGSFAIVVDFMWKIQHFKSETSLSEWFDASIEYWSAPGIFILLIIVCRFLYKVQMENSLIIYGIGTFIAWYILIFLVLSFKENKKQENPEKQITINR